MKVLAFNGSPRKEKGATDRILQQFMKGVKEAGAESETLYVAEKKTTIVRAASIAGWSIPGNAFTIRRLKRIKNNSDMFLPLKRKRPDFISHQEFDGLQP